MIAAAAISMMIMGCDDSETVCHYLATVDHKWETVTFCNAQAETYINRLHNANYPVIAAVCTGADNRKVGEVAEQTLTDIDTSTSSASADESHSETMDGHLGLGARTLNLIKAALPVKTALGVAFKAPVRYAEDGYTWVAKRFAY